MTLADMESRYESVRSRLLPRHIRGLLWREWLAHHTPVAATLAAYFTLALALLIFFHPGWVLAAGMLFVLIIGPVLAASEPLEGSEEFSFSLPATRSERYLVRLALWGGGFLLFLVFATLSVGLDLPQRLWGIFVETGFTRPNPPVQQRWLYGLAIAMPFAAFAFTFVIGALARTRIGAMASAFLGSVSAGAIFLAVVIVNAIVDAEPLLWSSVPLLLVAAAAALALGYVGYIRKEGISRPAPERRGGSRWIVLIIAALVLLFLLIMFFHAAVRGGEVMEKETSMKAAMERAVNEDLMMHKQAELERQSQTADSDAGTMPLPDNGR